MTQKQQPNRKQRRAMAYSDLEDRVNELEDELAQRPEGIQGAVEAIFSAVGNERPSAGEVDSLMEDIKGLLVTKYGVSAGNL